MWGLGKKARNWVNLATFLFVGLAAVILFRAVPESVPEETPEETIVTLSPVDNKTKPASTPQLISQSPKAELGLEPVKLKNTVLTLKEIEKLAQGWSSTSIMGLTDIANSKITSPQIDSSSAPPSQGCQVNRILDRLTERNVTSETEIFDALKMELTNTDCSPCLTKQKMIARLYEAAQQKFKWTETEDVAVQETALIENGLLPKEVSLFSDRTCVFHRDYGYAPDLLASASPLFATQNTAIGAINQADLSVLGSVYETPLSPSF